MAIQHLKPGTLSKAINWYTPTHRLYTVGKGGSGAFYAGRIKEPAFLITGDSQAEVEREAGRLINAHVGVVHGSRPNPRRSPRPGG